MEWSHANMVTTLEGFSFNDYCLRCQKVAEHKITQEEKLLFGVCSSCSQKRPLTDLNQLYYPKTELWVTRFKVGNLPAAVAGKLLDALKQTKS